MGGGGRVKVTRVCLQDARRRVALYYITLAYLYVAGDLHKLI